MSKQAENLKSWLENLLNNDKNFHPHEKSESFGILHGIATALNGQTIHEEDAIRVKQAVLAQWPVTVTSCRDAGDIFANAPKEELENEWYRQAKYKNLSLADMAESCVVRTSMQNEKYGLSEIHQKLKSGAVTLNSGDTETLYKKLCNYYKNTAHGYGDIVRFFEEKSGEKLSRPDSTQSVAPRNPAPGK